MAKLLSGGNPQVAKGEGDGPIRVYVDALDGWKREVVGQIDRLIVTAVPDVRKAVKWNSPLYGASEEGWFLSVHVFNKYVKVAFFRGQALDPVPPVASKSSDTRYLHVGEDGLDEAQFTSWVRQAAQLPPERL